MIDAEQHVKRAPERRGWFAAAALLVVATLAAPPVSGQAPCTGDCNGDGRVVIGELITGVNISLGNAELDICEAFDADHNGRADIYELVAAVGNALNSCTAGPPRKANKSGPIALSADGDTVVAVNTDTNTISIFDVAGAGTLTKAQEVEVGTEPRSVALLSNKPWAYVANTVSGTVQVINTDDYSTVATIEVGTEPWAVVASPNGLYAYVANATTTRCRSSIRSRIPSSPPSRSGAVRVRSPSPTTATPTISTNSSTCPTSSPGRAPTSRRRAAPTWAAPPAPGRHSR
jgi:YVTN family beta-propeller protein